MKIRHVFICYWMFVSFNSFSQIDFGGVSISDHTFTLMKIYYSSSEIEEIKNSPDDIKIMDYDFSKSFEVVGNQNYSSKQILSIDILKYRLDRKINEDVLVYDSVSKLNLRLYSLNKVDQDRKKLVPTYIIHEERGKNKSFNK